MKSRLFEGKVFHKRFKPKVHQLDYRVCSFLFDLDELEDLSGSLKLFAHNKWGVVSFWNKDHGPADDKPLRPYVEGLLDDAKIETQGGPIRLLCYPRLFGYVFNPLSVYYCYDHGETLKAIIYEVSNTFGERHSYVIPVVDGQAKVIKQSCRKDFYVSPFMEMDASYHFRMVPPDETVTVAITQTDHEGTLLKATFNGEKRDISDKALLGMILRHPLMTLKVIVGIHWEALKLWKKGMKLVTRPPAPESPVTLVTSNQLETKP